MIKASSALLKALDFLRGDRSPGREPSPPDGMLYSPESLRAADAIAEWIGRAIRDRARDMAGRDGRTMVEVADVRIAATELVVNDVGMMPYLLGLDRELGAIVAEYANAVGRYGPDSEQARGVRARRPGDAAFADLADSLDRIKRSLGGSGIDYPPPTPG